MWKLGSAEVDDERMSTRSSKSFSALLRDDGATTDFPNKNEKCEAADCGVVAPSPST